MIDKAICAYILQVGSIWTLLQTSLVHVRLRQETMAQPCAPGMDCALLVREFAHRNFARYILLTSPLRRRTLALPITSHVLMDTSARHISRFPMSLAWTTTTLS